MIICCAVLAAVSSALDSSSAAGGLRAVTQAVGDSHHRTVLASVPMVDKTMTICNAYASPKKLDVMLVRTRQVLTEGSPLAYKQCKEFTFPLVEGDQLDFKSAGLDVGTFYATGLPASAASLLLVPHRRNPHAVGMRFESHAFAVTQVPQIAVVNAYSGKEDAGSVKIAESLVEEGQTKESMMEEDLKFASVVAVNPGKYGISLSGVNKASLPLSAVGVGKYVVIKVGMEGDEKGNFPQELVVFPSGTTRTAMRLSALIVAVAASFIGLSCTM